MAMQRAAARAACRQHEIYGGHGFQKPSSVSMLLLATTMTLQARLSAINHWIEDVPRL